MKSWIKINVNFFLKILSESLGFFVQSPTANVNPEHWHNHIRGLLVRSFGQLTHLDSKYNILTVVYVYLNC
jgi:hypothetical protein